MNLECSSKGDKRFSAFYAKVGLNGDIDTIENHYQLSKRFIVNNKVITPKTVKDAKGKKPIYFEVLGKRFGVEHLTGFYNLLWVKYLDNNIDLVNYANKFNTFTDMFRGKAMNCQADIIKQYVKEGRSSIMESNEVKKFLKDISKPQEENVIFGDLFKSNTDIIAHQVNCQGVMGAGIALSIKEKYSKVFKTYNKVTNSYKNKKDLLGRCLLLSEKGEIIKKGSFVKNEKIIANLFGQYDYGNSLETDYYALESSLIELRDFAKENNLSIGVPYGIGCGLAGGDWEVVKETINKLFKDEMICIYRL